MANEKKSFFLFLRVERSKSFHHLQESFKVCEMFLNEVECWFKIVDAPKIIIDEYILSFTELLFKILLSTNLTKLINCSHPNLLQEFS